MSWESSRCFKTLFERTLLLFDTNFNSLLVDCYDDSLTMIRSKYNALNETPRANSGIGHPQVSQYPPWHDRGSTLAGCYFFCFSKRSNQEKETEIETHVVRPPTHKPKISAGMNFPVKRDFALGRNLNARDRAAHPHGRRFPERGSMIVQRYYRAQRYRNPRRPACRSAFGTQAGVRLENDPRV